MSQTPPLALTQPLASLSPQAELGINVGQEFVGCVPRTMVRTAHPTLVRSDFCSCLKDISKTFSGFLKPPVPRPCHDQAYRCINSQPGPVGLITKDHDGTALFYDKSKGVEH